MTHEMASENSSTSYYITFSMIVLHLNLTKFNVRFKMLSGPSSFPKGMSRHEKMECNRLEGSDHEGRQGSRDAVRSSRSSKKGRKRLEGSRKSEDGSDTTSLRILPSQASVNILLARRTNAYYPNCK